MSNQISTTTKRNSGIKRKLLCVLLPIVICVIAVIVVLVYFNTKKLLLQLNEEHVKTSTQSVVNKVEAWMEETITALEMERDTIQYMDMNEDEMLEYIKHTANVYDSFPAGIYTAISESSKLIHASFVPGPDYDINVKSWYHEGLASEKFIFGSVYFDEDSQSYVVGASGVLKDGSGQTIGVAAADIYLNAISEIVSQVQLEDTGSVFLVDGNTGTIIGHKDSEVVGVPMETLEDEFYTYVNNRITSGVLGLEVMEQNGNRIYVDVETVPESAWLAVAYVPETEVLSELQSLTTMLILVAVFGCILLVIFMERFINLIVKPIKQMSNTITSMSNGDFTVDVPVHTSDEIGVMAQSVRRFIENMRRSISQIIDISGTLSDQAESSSKISADLSGAASSMQEVSESVSNLQQSVQNVTQSTQSLSDMVIEAGDKGKTASQQMQEAVAVTEQGMGDVGAITEVMADISTKMDRLEESSVQMDESLEKISNMVKMIQDIAAKTNLLSLNASIEAARAGEAGRGFAVVAEEIGTLASTSQEAVEDISKLTEEIGNNIRNTVQESRESAKVIKDSNEIVEQTNQAFRKIYEFVTKTNQTVSEMEEKMKEVDGIAKGVVENTKEQESLSERILVSTTQMEENSRMVSEHSKDIAADVEGLKENAGLLNALSDTFKI